MSKQPNGDQLNAMVTFARIHGRRWKSHLNYLWMTGNYGFADPAPLLQQIRNEFGPSWLVSFRLPKA